MLVKILVAEKRDYIGILVKLWTNLLL